MRAFCPIRLQLINWKLTDWSRLRLSNLQFYDQNEYRTYNAILIGFAIRKYAPEANEKLFRDFGEKYDGNFYGGGKEFMVSRMLVGN